MTISTLVWGPAPRVREQLVALGDAPGAGIELLVATDGPLAEPSDVALPVARMLTTTAVGRRAAWQLAAEHAHGDVLVVLDQLAQPTVEVIRLLVDAVRRGAVLAAPAIASASSTTHGYRDDARRRALAAGRARRRPRRRRARLSRGATAVLRLPARVGCDRGPSRGAARRARALARVARGRVERAARPLLGGAGALDRGLYAEPRGRDRRVHRRVRRPRPGGQRQRAHRRRQRLDRLDTDRHRGPCRAARRPRAHRARAGGRALARPQRGRGRGARRRAVLPRRRCAPRSRLARAPAARVPRSRRRDRGRPDLRALARRAPGGLPAGHGRALLRHPRPRRRAARQRPSRGRAVGRQLVGQERA